MKAQTSRSRRKSVVKSDAAEAKTPLPRTEAEEQLVAEWNRRSDERLNTPPSFTLDRIESEWRLGAPNTADSELWKAKLAQALGNTSKAAHVTLFDQLAKILVSHTKDDARELQSLDGAIALLHGIAPHDTMEAILATQMVAVQKIAMDQLRLASLPNQPSEFVTHQTNRAARLMRLFTLQMDALQRYRGKVPSEQVVRVEQVTVEAGAQAVIGSVTTSGKGGEAAGGQNKNA